MSYADGTSVVAGSETSCQEAGLGGAASINSASTNSASTNAAGTGAAGARTIGEVLSRWQNAINSEGESFSSVLNRRYVAKWNSGPLADVMRIRTALVLGQQEFLADKGLVNIDRVSMSPITDPLCHDVEHVPVISYQDVPYRTTHSMIYSKFLACMNPRVKGIFIDSSNIRLELPHEDPVKRRKYLIDFSQMDVEARRESQICGDDYLDKPTEVSGILEGELDKALDFFEDMIIAAVARILATCSDSLAALNISLAIPAKPFPRFYKDECEGPEEGLEKRLGQKAGSQFFWILGLMRENYDLVYPFLGRDGSVPSHSAISSRQIYNYDLCASALYPDGGRGEAFEVLSGGLREWFYPAIIARLLDNKVISEAPRFDSAGNITNMEELDGYGPFLAAAASKTQTGESAFPQTFGGGLGIERTLFALLQGPVIHSIDEVTYFGKNPDAGSPFLF
ncbi:MAG: hypothetical protein LLF89_06755 [Spirochaetaceae bacterium]|nr:hypothetical protein [Spirochaetaceae bacterium]